MVAFVGGRQRGLRLIGLATIPLVSDHLLHKTSNRWSFQRGSSSLPSKVGISLKKTSYNQIKYQLMVIMIIIVIMMMTSPYSITRPQWVNVTTMTRSTRTFWWWGDTTRMLYPQNMQHYLVMVIWNMHWFAQSPKNIWIWVAWHPYHDVYVK